MLLSIAVSLIPIKMTSSDLVMLGLCLISESIFSLVKFNPCFLVMTGLSPTFFNRIGRNCYYNRIISKLKSISSVGFNDFWHTSTRFIAYPQLGKNLEKFFVSWY